jgi:hypothetical protein
MNQNLISAVFDNQSEAETAVRELREAGVRDTDLSIIARNEGRGATTSDGAGTVTDDSEGDGIKGAVLGAGAGTLLGIAALAIPGVGPLVAAGAIASSAIPGAAAIGAGVGAVTGGILGMLTSHGVSDEDATYYEGRINEGGVFVSVDASNAAISPQAARDILYRNGGHNTSRQKATASTY